MDSAVQLGSSHNLAGAAMLHHKLQVQGWQGGTVFHLFVNINFRTLSILVVPLKIKFVPLSKAFKGKPVVSKFEG